MDAVDFDFGEEGPQLHKRPTVVVPHTLQDIMNGLMKSLQNTSHEFMIYLKGRWDPTQCAVIVETDEFHMPLQEASSGLVRALDDVPGLEWNVAIHRHPPGVRGFSGTDDRDINRCFLASMLFLPPADFPTAIINIPISSDNLHRLEVKAEIILDYGGKFDFSELVAQRHRPMAARPMPGAYTGGFPRPQGSATTDAAINALRTGRPMAADSSDILDDEDFAEVLGERDFSEGGMHKFFLGDNDRDQVLRRIPVGRSSGLQRFQRQVREVNEEEGRRDASSPVVHTYDPAIHGK